MNAMLAVFIPSCSAFSSSGRGWAWLSAGLVAASFDLLLYWAPQGGIDGMANGWFTDNTFIGSVLCTESILVSNSEYTTLTSDGCMEV